MSLLERLMERTGRTAVPRYARDKVGARAIVQASSEFHRISALPRREWAGDRIAWTELFRTDKGQMGLWPIQAAALEDIVGNSGAFLPIGVGQGKALISLLAAAVLSAERPILFVPASLREQTMNKVVPEMFKHWRLPEHLAVVGYSELSLEKNADMLEGYRPDLIILDECHEVKNRKAGRTRRLIRYFREHPETKCVAMSGTISNRSLRDFAHIIEWCLKDRTPLPRPYQELKDWADAIDEKVPDESRVAPGVLMEFCEPGENVRQGFRRRFTQTPGVVASFEGELGTSLRILRRVVVDAPLRIKRMVHSMREHWETPNGDLISEAVDLWRHIRELSLGFWYRWEPAAPREWLQARRDWKAYVRETLKNNRRGLDTELQVWNECARAAKPPQVWEAWRDIGPSFSPNSVPQWESDFALAACADWLRDGGICWTEHVAFGEALGEYSGLPYFGAGDFAIIDTPAPAVIASIAAHRQGKNLQRFSRNLVTCPPTSGKEWEQLLGRTHRPGQKADEVTCEVFLHFAELEKSFEQARADARFIEDTFGNRQKLNYADLVI